MARISPSIHSLCVFFSFFCSVNCLASDSVEKDATTDHSIGLHFVKNGSRIFGLKGTDKGPPTESTDILGYLDHFVLEVRLVELGSGASISQNFKLAAWFGKASEKQIEVKLSKEDDRGKPYNICDEKGQLVPPEFSNNATAIPFHPEPSNKVPLRANLSKGIGGAPIPMIAAEAGTKRLYSTMHQRFSYSLFGSEEKHFKEFGARYSLAQVTKLPFGVYHLELPFTIVLIDSAKQVVAVNHGEIRLKLDLSEKNREDTLESLKGSGAPLLFIESGIK